MVLAAAVLAPLAASAERIERTFPADDDTTVEIRNYVGQVKVHGWSQPQVKVVALRKTQAVEPHLELKANRVYVHTHELDTTAAASDRVLDYEVWAPPETQIDIRLDSGAVLVENFTQDVRVSTAAAGVRVYRLDGYSTVGTLSGGIEAESCAGRIEITTVSGSVWFRANDSRNLVAGSTSGDIFFEGDLQRGASYEFRTNSGDINITLPAAASFELNARSVEGEVHNDFPLSPRSHGRPPQQANALRSSFGTVLSGDALIRASSFSGTIRVRKR
jgi:DUF4097 and DUF4098 domain-containing protein YvlB